jgi:hypothetical protein
MQAMGLLVRTACDSLFCRNHATIFARLMNTEVPSMPSSFRRCQALLTVALLLSPPVFAFDTPLSDQAIREAYFLGQRRDESMADFLNKYTRFLLPPESGPHIYSVTFLTPFALLVQQSSQRINYSAQQAAKEHHGDREIVSITIEILLTPSYGALIPRPTGSRSDSPVGYQFRNPDFWKDIKFDIFDGEKKLSTDSLTGEPNYLCAADAACDLTGATVHLELPAKLFTSGTATIDVTPPEGDPVSIDFDLSSFR